MSKTKEYFDQVKSDSQEAQILVADDSPTALKMTTSVLAKYNYHVITACDGEQAVNVALSKQPSACVIDLKMPKKDGFQVCKEIKKQKENFIPILLLTAREDIESLVAGLESGADDYIIKPFNEMEFIARIRVLLRLKKLNEELLNANRRLHYLSTHDELTDLYNHRYFIESFNQIVKTAYLEKSDLGLALFDIDHFKQINDTYGHLEGDKVLKKIATLLQDSFTSDTILARYGGEEFVAVFPNRKPEFVINAVQQVINDCAQRVFKFEKFTYRVTLSAGIASTSTTKSYSTRELIQSADQLLYHSKNTGRNKVSFLQKTR